ncbi:SAM-dependent methyltransferase [Pseudooceanicola aestuarii]|uniref:SAM-dependent methyltransferase n=1 Tax=Pseudooceanicola aestuarii TaxID=2697319 RepID=UPI0013D3C501|nr:cyclopropane-fatty-acyl-phospholipid synthase family protein [Pseudooceanicola aestuarii]
MWKNLLFRFLDAGIRTGRLTVTLADGTRRPFGDPATGPDVAITLRDADLPRKLVMNLELATCEAYMDERLLIDGDDLRGLLTLALSNRLRRDGMEWQRPLAALRRALRRVAQWNPVGRAQDNVAHHYDLSGALYDLFLDSDRQYSCAYWPRPGMTLEQAQEAKKHHIARKLLLRPDLRVLDIGCGWGGMALTLARDYGLRVTGVTLSREQHQIATARVRDAGLEDRVDIRLQDYRQLDQQFDRVVSVGMFEHVGTPHYREYFRHVHDFLAPDGVALIHTIGRASPPGTTNDFIRKYIFPGGYVPALSETMAAVERQELFATDIEIWRLHYAETLKVWHDRFMANIDAARALYDDRFCRMWRLYLLASELTFRLSTQVVFQIQIARRQDAVPLTRDYLLPAESHPTAQAAQ